MTYCFLLCFISIWFFITINFHLYRLFLQTMVWKQVYITDKDKNFALEWYGESSRCIDHTEQMWEERSCTQVRQWQHWGSGCYQYTCKAGRLHLQVSHTVNLDRVCVSSKLIGQSCYGFFLFMFSWGTGGSKNFPIQKKCIILHWMFVLDVMGEIPCGGGVQVPKLDGTYQNPIH